MPRADEFFDQVISKTRILVFLLVLKMGLMIVFV